MYKKAEATWTVEEIDLSKDIHDWNNHLTDNERHFISHVLAFFAATDGIINEEPRWAFFEGRSSRRSIKHKADWALKWITDKWSIFAERLVVFTAVEGIFFSGSFASIFWMKRGLSMPGLTFSDELICRDEGMHTLCVLLFSHLRRRPHPDTVRVIITEAVTIEQEFLTGKFFSVSY
jgi:ribonucleoside-diphosphate reductase subunit M2